MATTDPVSCPRCGAAVTSDDPGGFRPPCRRPDAWAGRTEDPPVPPSARGGARRKVTLASAVAGIVAILLGALGCGKQRGQQSADADAHFNRGNALQEQGKLEEAIAAYRAAIRLQPDYADAHDNLGIALEDRGKLEEAVAAFREAIRLRARPRRRPRQPRQRPARPGEAG